MSDNSPSQTPERVNREDLEWDYLDELEFNPYPFQEEAIDSWFAPKEDGKHGTLVCAPTGMGKTLIAEAAIYEALRTNKKAYYTTPLIALTEQKYAELQEKVEQWGFKRTDVGLITGNRRENADAPILVVVAEILFNRLISSDSFVKFAESQDAKPATVEAAPQDADKPRITAASLNAKKSVVVDWRDEEKAKQPQFAEEKQRVAPPLPEIPVNPDDFEDDLDFDPEDAFFSFEDVSAVVMDEFHQFSDPERGVVWEFTLALLPLHVRALLISATVGNAVDFQRWLERTSGRKLHLVTSTERKVPLMYNWVDDKYVSEELREMRKGEQEGTSLTPALATNVGSLRRRREPTCVWKTKRAKSSSNRNSSSSISSKAPDRVYANFSCRESESTTRDCSPNINASWSIFSRRNSSPSACVRKRSPQG